MAIKQLSYKTLQILASPRAWQAKLVGVISNSELLKGVQLAKFLLNVTNKWVNSQRFTRRLFD